MPVREFDIPAMDEMREPYTAGSRLLLEAAGLDPMGVNGLMVELPHAISSGNTDLMLRPLRDLGSRALDGAMGTLDLASEVARLRDAGYFGGAAQRTIGKGRNLIGEVPGLEQAFFAISASISAAQVGGSGVARVPRDTISEMLAQHPSHKKLRRSYTGGRPEEIFGLALQESDIAVDRAIEALAPIDLHQDHAPDFMDDLLARLSVAYAACIVMNEVQDDVDDGVPDEVFNHHIQPNFPGLTIGDQTWNGAGGSGHPILVLDHMIRGYELRDSSAYGAHFRASLPYTTISQQRALQDFTARNGRSLVGHVWDERIPHDGRIILQDCVIAVCGEIDQWRGDHWRKASKGFAGRPEGATGSGGGTPGMLLEIHREMQRVTRGLRDVRSEHRYLSGSSGVRDKDYVAERRSHQSPLWRYDT